MSGRRIELTVTPGHAGKTVDTLLRRELALSGTVIKRAKRVPDGILLDGKAVYVTQTVSAGQRLSVLVGDTSADTHLPAVPGPLDLVYEDGDLLVLNKAPGIAVHPGPGHYDDTICNFMLYYYEKSGIQAHFRPVNRLDRGTSGLMVIAKHAHTQELLKQQLHSQAFRRVYLAVCDGTPSPPSGVVDAPIGRAEGSALRREVRPDGAQARTHYQVLQTAYGRALLRLELETGRTHQIRVHMAYLGCPLTGDFLYGVEDTALISRAALHSADLSFLHPITGKELYFTSPLPEDIKALIHI